jgi:hypothetical protein
VLADVIAHWSADLWERVATFLRLVRDVAILVAPLAFWSLDDELEGRRG